MEKENEEIETEEVYELDSKEDETGIEEYDSGLSTGMAMLLGGALVAVGYTAIKYGSKGISFVKRKIQERKDQKNGFVVDGVFKDLDNDTADE